MGFGLIWDELPQGEFVFPFTVIPRLNHSLKLVTTDEKKTVIAEFHRSHHFTRKEKARLDIQPAGMNMLDHIVLTWVFAENKRKEREAAAASA